MSKKFVLAITEHRKFGILFSSYIITPDDGPTFYSSIEKANPINIKEIQDGSDTIEKIQTLISQYDDHQIASFFTKKRDDAKNFIKNVDAELIESRIRPFIETRLHKIIKCLIGSEINIYYKDRRYVKIYSADKVTYAGPNASAVFNFNRTEEGIQYFLNISHDNKSISLKNKTAQILTDNPCTIIIGQKLYRFQNIDSKKLKPFFEKDYVNIAKQSEKMYFEKFVFNAIKSYPVNAKGFSIVEKSVSPSAYLYLQNDLGGNPVTLLKFKYNDQLILPNNTEPIFLNLDYSEDNVVFTKLSRLLKEESQTIEQLKDIDLSTNDSVHFYPKITDTNDDIHSRLFDLISWFNKNANKVQALGIEVKQDYFEKKYILKKVSAKLNIEETNDWFDVKGTVELGEFKIPFIKLRKHIIKNIREYVLPDDTIAILPLEWFAKYKELFAFAEHDALSLKLNKMHFGLIYQNFEGINAKKFGKIEDLFNENYETSSDVPEGINAQLRPYQITGFNWMRQLQENNFGGCLADDMGLGKTLQTITLLYHNSKTEVDAPIETKDNNKSQLSLFDTPIQSNNSKVSPTSIIVMPASLVHNWYNEIKKFTPDLKALKHIGPLRTKEIFNFSQYDVVLTTYGVIRNDADLMKRFPFHYLILDESQAIKNPESKNYKSLIQLKSKHKLVLTGTPIENSLTDLWSQINLVNRGLLGNFNFFKREFVIPIEKNKSEAKSTKLQALIHPFILRRTKNEVAKDLPPKTEQVRLCEMSTAQKKLYEEEKSAVRNNFLEKMEQLNRDKSSMQILAAITRLRQLANHPKLIDSDADSGKFDEVIRMLQNVISEGHKVLIFSSFVQHLELYKEYLEKKGLTYSLLTGQTRDRQGVIEDFQNNEDNHVFLISLKAGGVGLNLTAADYVFLLDPWWNPASENQAINRAHRIGQDKKVFVYRFIAAGSIEEKIVQLQAKKSELAEQFVNSNNPFKAFSADNLNELFS